MIDARDVRLELWDESGVVMARLARGADGAWSELVGPTAIVLPRALLTQARDLRSHQPGDQGATRALLEHGCALWRALAPFHGELRAMMQSGAVRRMVLAAGAPAPGRPVSPAAPDHLWAKDAFELLWPALFAFRDATGSLYRPDDRFLPFLRGAWSLLLRDGLDDGVPEVKLRLETLSVLVLLTSLEDSNPEVARQLRSGAVSLVREVRRAFAGNDAVRVLIAASTRYRDGRGGLLGEPGAELWFEDANILEHVVRHGALPGQADRPLHAVVLLGHSDAPTGGPRFGDLATALLFALPGAEVPVPVSGAELAQWLTGPKHREPDARSPLQVVVASNCASVGFGAALRACAPHVVVTSSVVPVDDQVGITCRFVARLAADRTVGEALREAVADIPVSAARLLAASRTLHFAATVHDQQLISDEVGALVEHYGRVLPDHELIHTAYGRQRSVLMRQIHVDLTLSDEPEHDREELGGARPGPIAQRGELRGTKTFPELVGQHGAGRFLLLGEAGAGKTTTLRHFALEPPAGALPLYLSLPVWLRDPIARPATYELDPLVRSMVGFLRSGERQCRAFHHRQADVVVMLDGFDELRSDDERRAAVEIAKSLAAGWDRAKLVVAARDTARVDEFQQAGWLRARLRPLDPHVQQPALLRNWFVSAGLGEVQSEADAKRWARDLQRANDRVTEMAGNPLMLSFIAQKILDGWTSQDFERGRHELVSSILGTVIARSYTKESRPEPVLDLDHARIALRWIAWQSLRAPTRSIAGVEGVAELLKKRPAEGDADALEELRDAVASLRRPFKSWDALARELGVQGGVFRPEYGEGSRDWRFGHNVLQEALAAEHWWFVVLGQRSDVDAVVRHLRDRMAEGKDAALDFWTEPTALLAGWMQSDELLLRLLDPHERLDLDLGLRVMRGLDRVRPETWARVLAQLPAWEFDLDRARRGEKGPRVLAYEAIASRSGATDLDAVLDVLIARAVER
ncbi:MAG: NACHT domain-containing protein [Planctomycetes bacterium]|nr:NACHT domain-containing protein [Planctomycetota bacterium]